MVLATMFIAGIMILVFGDVPRVFQGTYTVFVKFQNAPGVTAETPVRKSGILIGRVADVQFASDDGVIITLSVKATQPLRRDEVCVINSSILGDAVLQFVPPSEGQRTNELIADGDFIQGRVATDPLEMISKLEGVFGQAVVSVSSASDDIGSLARNLNNLLANNEEQLTRIVTKTEGTIDTIRRAMGNMEALIGDEQVRNDLTRAISQMPGLLADARQAMTGLNDAVGPAGQVMQNLQKITGDVAQGSDGLGQRLNDVLGRVDQMLLEFGNFGQALNRPDGSLGRMINDPDFYQHLNAAVINIEKLTCDLRPIIADARVFTDKIARHPETLGVRGAIQRSPGFK